MNLLKKIKKWLFNLRCARAIKKAEKYYRTTRRHALVLLVNGKPIVKYRYVLKSEVRQKKWNCKLEYLERLAIYKTY